MLFDIFSYGNEKRNSSHNIILLNFFFFLVLQQQSQGPTNNCYMKSKNRNIYQYNKNVYSRLIKQLLTFFGNSHAQYKTLQPNLHCSLVSHSRKEILFAWPIICSVINQSDVDRLRCYSQLQEIWIQYSFAHSLL